MRSGPKPLPFQLSMASMAAAGLAGGGTFTPEMLQNFFSGIQKYQKYDYRRMSTSWPTTFEKGQVRLFYAKSKGLITQKFPIVLVPSMINKSDILDIAPGRSMMAWFSNHGFDVYLLDWGAPTKDDAQNTVDAAIETRLIPALESIGVPVLLMGYCMGGLICAAVAKLRPELVRGAMFLATPWNFHDEVGALKARLEIAKPMASFYLKQHGYLPESWMQAVFATLDPESAIRKFSNFALMPESDPRADLFVAVEDWLNDGVDLPSGIAQMCLTNWYEENQPYLGTWNVLGQNIRAQDIKVSTFVVAASDDKIVPKDSALAFADQRLKCDRLVCKTGHIGLIAGGNVVDQVWKPSLEWFAAQQ